MADSIKKDRIKQEISDAESNAEVLLMTEAGHETGYIVVDIKDSTIRILKLIIEKSVLNEQNPEALMIADSLMRAAASYGASLGAYQIESRITEFQNYFQSVGFLKSKNGFLCNLSNIIKICDGFHNNP